MENNSKFNLFSKVEQSNNINNYSISLSDEQFKEYMKATKSNNTKTEIQNIINSIFEDSANIVNKKDSIFYINKKDKEKLVGYIDKLETFKVFFNEKEEQTTIFYINMFSILMRINCKRILSLFHELPIYLKSNNEILYIYGCALSESKLYDEAIEIFDDLYKENNNIYAFIQKLLCLLLQNKYSDLYELTKNIKKGDIDNYGYIASYYLIAKCEIQKLTESEIKKLNAKFGDKPLFCSTAAIIISTKINKKSKSIKEYIKDGLRILNDLPFNISATTIFIEQCSRLNVNEYIVKYLNDYVEESVHLNTILLNTLINQKNKSEKDFKNMENVIIFLEKEKAETIDINKAKAQICLQNHKELEAITYLTKSFDLEENEEVAYKCLQLIINNHDDNINSQKYIECLKKSKSPKMVMLAAHGLQYQKKQAEAKNEAIKSLYLLGNNFDVNIYRWFWGIFMFDEDKKNPNLDYVTCNCAVTIKNKLNNKKQVIIIDEHISETYKIMDAICYPTSNLISIELLNREKNEDVTIEDVSYKIIDIINKDCYMLRKVMEKLSKKNKNNKFFKEFKYSENDDDPLKEIRELLIEDREYLKKKFDQYDIEQNTNPGGYNSLPLSNFCDNEKNYQSIIELLLYNKDMKLYAGEPNLLDLNNNKIVIDLTSLVVLQELNQLELLLPYVKNIYFTKSLKNKVNSIFQKVSNEKEKTMRIFVDDENNLHSTETTKESKKNNVNFWRAILSLINQCNIEEFETNMDSDNFDKSQFDMFNLAIDKNMIYICDDLTIRKLAYAVSKGNLLMTNSSSIINLLHDTNPSEYIKIMNQLTEFKYIHCIDCLSLFYLTLDVLNMRNNEEYKQYYKKIIQNILESKFLYECHISTIQQFLSTTFRLFKITKESNELFDIIFEETKNKSIEYAIPFDIKTRNELIEN